MPIYEYICEACKVTEERLVPIKDASTLPLPPCPVCHQAMKKTIGIATARFPIKKNKRCVWT